jgi:hypothetical protein
LIEALDIRFAWGVLVIEDEATSDPAPPWESPETQATQARGIVVLRVRHGQEGRTLVHLCRDVGDLSGQPAYDGLIDVPSGVLSVGDASREARIRMDVPPGSTRLRVIANRARLADHVDVVIVDLARITE